MKKLFTSDEFFLAMVLFAVIGKVACILISILFSGFNVQYHLVLLFRVACVIVLYISYKCHSKNVMKGMMGALLAVQLLTAVSYLSGFQASVDYICLPLFAVLSVLLFVNHFIINSDRQPSPSMIKLNQILVALLFLNIAVLDVSWIVINPTPMEITVSILDIVSFLGMSAAIVCIESRLDAYRLDRVAAGWTEEKGYPEGYVHEYQKK